MTFRTGVVVGVLSVAFAGALGIGIATNGVETLRVLLALCAVVMLAATSLYAADGFTEQAVGHAVAGIGLAVAAGVGEGVAVWTGVLVASVGVFLLVQDAIRRGRNWRPSA